MPNPKPKRGRPSGPTNAVQLALWRPTHGVPDARFTEGRS